MTKPLAGRGIVVTRPAHQAAHLAELITAAGGNAILFPTLEIADVDDPGPLVAMIDRLERFDLAVFVSPNAVTRAMALITARRALPPHLRLATVGAGGARELERQGAGPVIAPQRFDSEALLEMPEMRDVAGKRIVIFRGEGGRALLGETLSARGAVVEYAVCYRRRRPQADPMPLLAAWDRGSLHAITATSSEGVRNLVYLVGERGGARLVATPLFVPHERIAATAHGLGFACVVRTGQGDGGLLAGLEHWFSTGGAPAVYSARATD